jgi:Uma2 family endonuclease
VSENIKVALGHWVRTNRLGRTFSSETGYFLRRHPDTVRCPDGSFITTARVPDPLPVGFCPIVPDLVVEVVSPSDREGEVLGKVGEWLDCGVGVVWLVRPKRRQIVVYHRGREEVVLRAEDTLSDPDLLPGFALPVAEVFV